MKCKQPPKSCFLTGHITHSVTEKSTPKYLDNGINWASFLTKSTVDTLWHIDVIACSATTSICSFFSFYSNGLIKTSHSLRLCKCTRLPAN